MTDDPGVRSMLQFNLARDTMHQRQWLAAIEDLHEEGLEDTLVPNALFDEENSEHAASLWHLSDGAAAAAGRWASGTTPDGMGEFRFIEDPQPLGGPGGAPAPDPLLYATASEPGKKGDNAATSAMQKVKNAIS